MAPEKLSTGHAHVTALPPASEPHPFEPFLPRNARILFLGSFPPQPKRWCMDFYYPNFINDFWRITGRLFFADQDYFTDAGRRRFDKDRIVAFCNREGLAFYDTATEVRRLRDNASDRFLEVVTPTDLPDLLRRIPDCRAVATTGQKATDTLCATLPCPPPPMGGYTDLSLAGRSLRFYRMPSTSRAYPLSLEKKAAAYRILFEEVGLL